MKETEVIRESKKNRKRIASEILRDERGDS